MEFEAVDEGVLAKILVAEGTDDVAVGAVIAVMAEEDEDVAEAAANAGNASTGNASAPKPDAAEKAVETPAANAQQTLLLQQASQQLSQQLRQPLTVTALKQAHSLSEWQSRPVLTFLPLPVRGIWSYCKTRYRSGTVTTSKSCTSNCFYAICTSSSTCSSNNLRRTC